MALRLPSHRPARPHHRRLRVSLAETASEHIRQVVLVAAGLATRAFRLRWPPHVHLFELDQPEVVAYKDAVLRSRRAEPTCRRTVVEVDLREPWTPALIAAGFRPSERSVWLAEGLAFYLDEAAVRRLFSDMATPASPGGGLGTDSYRWRLQELAR